MIVRQESVKLGLIPAPGSPQQHRDDLGGIQLGFATTRIAGELAIGQNGFQFPKPMINLDKELEQTAGLTYRFWDEPRSLLE